MFCDLNSNYCSIFAKGDWCFDCISIPVDTYMSQLILAFDWKYDQETTVSMICFFFLLSVENVFVKHVSILIVHWTQCYIILLLRVKTLCNNLCIETFGFSCASVKVVALHSICNPQHVLVVLHNIHPQHMY